MIILAVILIIFSIIKIISLQYTRNLPILEDYPDYIYNIAYAIALLDGLIGLFCGLYIVI